MVGWGTCAHLGGRLRHDFAGDELAELAGEHFEPRQCARHHRPQLAQQALLQELLCAEGDIRGAAA